jgi:hypothetical protein
VTARKKHKQILDPLSRVRGKRQHKRTFPCKEKVPLPNPLSHGFTPVPHGAWDPAESKESRHVGFTPVPQLRALQGKCERGINVTQPCTTNRKANGGRNPKQSEHSCPPTLQWPPVIFGVGFRERYHCTSSASSRLQCQLGRLETPSPFTPTEGADP